jgi:hypothetical protein
MDPERTAKRVGARYGQKKTGDGKRRKRWSRNRRRSKGEEGKEIILEDTEIQI